MRRGLHLLAAAAFVVMTGAFAAWAAGGAGLVPGALMVAPLALCCALVWRRSVRPLVAGGALALPYLCVAIVEIVSSATRGAAPVVALAAGVVFMSLLAPVTRNARLAARGRGD